MPAALSWTLAISTVMAMTRPRASTASPRLRPGTRFAASLPVVAAGTPVAARTLWVSRISREDVNASRAFFDIKKLTAFNGEYIRALPLEKFVEACELWLRAPYATWAPEDFDQAAWEAIAPYAQTRVAVLSDITANVDFLFLKEPVEDEASWARR